MNFKKLQAMQAKLDEAILANKPEMTAQERFNKDLVGLSTEIAEIANCSGHFKYWKENKGKIDGERFVIYDRETDTSAAIGCKIDKKSKQQIIDEQGHPATIITEYSNEQALRLTLVEECADALHFILSLANQLRYEIEIKHWTVMTKTKESNLMYINRDMFQLFESYQYEQSRVLHSQSRLIIVILGVFSYFNQLGVTKKELEQAYYDKNKINYERLESGY